MSLRILVCVKQVPDPEQFDRITLDPDTGSINRGGIPPVTNPADRHAVEEALRIREILGGSVTVLTMGPPQARKCLEDALAMGADRGVLLLNATLTVRANQAGSHQNRGWETFTDMAIHQLSLRREGLVFILWGAYAQAKEYLIDTSRHHVLKAAHPSPFSANRGFFGCRHFSKTNDLLAASGLQPIDWKLDG